VDLVTRHLSSDHVQATVCFDDSTLLHRIGCEFYTSQETREPLYTNRKAGISNLTLTLHSSFGTVLPEILDKSTMVGAENNGLMLPCAKSYKDGFCNDYGVTMGVKPRILEGSENQRAVDETILENLSATHPSGATMAHKLLHRCCNFNEMMVTA
jgi:hypothetical protein